MVVSDTFKKWKYFYIHNKQRFTNLYKNKKFCCNLHYTQKIIQIYWLERKLGLCTFSAFFFQNQQDYKENSTWNPKVAIFFRKKKIGGFGIVLTSNVSNFCLRRYFSTNLSFLSALDMDTVNTEKPKAISRFFLPHICDRRFFRDPPPPSFPNLAFQI